jgi:hypothetical protein
VFANYYEPIKVGDFLRVGNDFYITASEQAIERGLPLLYFAGAYEVLRTAMVISQRKEAASELDIDGIRSHISSLTELVKRLSDLRTKATTIHNNSIFILETVDEMEGEPDKRLEIILELLS